MSKHRGKQPRFVQLFHWEMDNAAYKDLDGNARAIYVEIKRRYNGTNNGRIGYSARTAATELKICKTTAAKALRSLQVHGFIVVEKRGEFHCKIRHASEYRLTIYDSDIATNYADKLATKEFMRWENIQNTVRLRVPTGPVGAPYGTPTRTVSSKYPPDGAPTRTVKAVFNG